MIAHIRAFLKAIGAQFIFSPADVAERGFFGLRVTAYIGKLRRKAIEQIRVVLF